MKKKVQIGALVTLATLSTSFIQAQAAGHQSHHKYNASDVIRYALTSHGINYVLRSKFSKSLNRWKFEPKKANALTEGAKKVKQARWGTTDCSGLASAAYRYGRYYRPEEKRNSALVTKGGHVLGTVHFNAMATNKNGYENLGKKGFSVVATKRSKIQQTIKHGDNLNRTGKPVGHIILFNGKKPSTNEFYSVEARGSGYGVGRMRRGWNLKGKYKTIRQRNVYMDVADINKSFSVKEASIAKTTLGKSGAAEVAVVEVKPGEGATTTIKYETYKVVRGDVGGKIARKHGISFSKLEAANPSVNWRRIRIGDSIKIPVEVVVEEKPVEVVAETQSETEQAEVATIPTPRPRPEALEEEQTETEPAEVVTEETTEVAQVEQEAEQADVPVAEVQEEVAPVETVTTIVYKVRAGDYGGKIAKKHGISFAKLDAANPGVKWKRIKIGQKINIPSDAVEVQSHTVRRGQSLWTISKKYGVSIKKIKSANGMTRKNPVLKIGQVIKIPNS